MSSLWESWWDPEVITIADENIPNDWKVCVLQGAIDSHEHEHSSLGGRIAAIFVVLVTSLIATAFPVVARRVRWLRIPQYAYVIAKNFGTGVIVTTAFIHLMDPAYSSIGANSCVGGLGHWADYAWCPAIILAGAIGTFIVDAYCNFFSESWFGVAHNHDHDEAGDAITRNKTGHSYVHQHDHAGCGDEADPSELQLDEKKDSGITEDVSSINELREFRAQFSGFMILEIGVIVHSVFIGLALGASSEWVTLFIVIIFHQMFEGLGIGSRMSMIPFPKNRWWWPYVLIVAYALTTPIAIAIGIGVRESYQEDGLNQMRVQGICDAISCGILVYTGFVELVARDFIFNKESRTFWDLTFQLIALLWGAGLMALLGKWA